MKPALESPVYVAGPMRGRENLNYRNFDRVTKLLRDAGFVVFNPAENFHPDPNLTLKDCLPTDLGDLLQCQSMVVLDDWEGSAGATTEAFVHHRCGRSMFSEHDWSTPIELEVALSIHDKAAHQESILEEAQRLVMGNRGTAYGHPRTDMGRTAMMWSALLGVPVTAKLVALCMCCVKLSREINRPSRDNRTDLAGYALCADRIERYEAGDHNS